MEELKVPKCYYKVDVIDSLKNYGERNVRNVMINIIKEYNATHLKKINLYSRTIPKIIYEQLIDYFTYED